AAASAVPAGFKCPEGMICRPKPSGSKSWIGVVHHLHSGETFGPLGTLIASLSGLAMVFFAFSGLWMYTRMWSHRRTNNHKPGWFWK
ncbi:MAG: PepSY domain-containing protein, partial [Novosphingobium sp.]|uniref:PepSY domain-containing protein n=1 Tax=Novosphingobium sp. TaxID=1874826 RepID=UPI003C7D46FF